MDIQTSRERAAEAGSVQETVRRIRKTLREEGIEPALRMLNRAGNHRFTALYRIEGGDLHNLYFVDRNDATVERRPSGPVLDSYCIYVQRRGQPFIVEESKSDERVSGHPMQNVVQSYCGVPLLDEQGLFGTLCHFDYDPIPFAKEEVAVLDELAPDLLVALRKEG